MKLAQLQISNFRTIEDLTLGFPKFYSAISGKNDSGKTNILRALRVFFNEEDFFVFPPDEGEISIKDDFPKWLARDSKEKAIRISVRLEVNRYSDEGLYLFLSDYLGIPEKPDFFTLTLTSKFSGDTAARSTSLDIEGKTYEDLKVQEVLKKLQNSSYLLFHDSTEYASPMRFHRIAGLLSDLSASDGEQLDLAKRRLDRAVRKIAKRSQEDLSHLLGRLKDQYRIGLSAPKFDLAEFPFSITLGTPGVDVPLEDWGSGTQNRTRILMTLFKARRVSQGPTSPAKVAPIIVIEEPESFLHPAAQGEFAKALKDLSEEFKVQVIVATHSPYFLSHTDTEANVLLERHKVRRGIRETRQVDTSGEQWMQPFAVALGLDNEQFKPWREVLFTNQESILLVEGDTDKEYLALLLDERHGDRRLRFQGEVFAYGGKDSLKQRQLLRFIKERYKRFVVTYDLDAGSEVEPLLVDAGLRSGLDYLAIGKDVGGKRSIEGLLPESVVQTVYSVQSELVQKALHGSKDEKKSANGMLKRLQLEEFKKACPPGDIGFKDFYVLARQLNKMLS